MGLLNPARIYLLPPARGGGVRVVVLSPRKVVRGAREKFLALGHSPAFLARDFFHEGVIRRLSAHFALPSDVRGPVDSPP
jgi:hypothetical protein